MYTSKGNADLNYYSESIGYKVKARPFPHLNDQIFTQSA